MSEMSVKNKAVIRTVMAITAIMILDFSIGFLKENNPNRFGIVV